MSEYSIVLALVTIPTLLLSFHPQSNMKGRLGNVLIAIVLSAIPFIIWDIWAYNQGLWGFNPEFIIGFRLFDLPIEEVLFFLCVPFSSLYVWLVVKDFTTFADLLRKIKNN